MLATLRKSYSEEQQALYPAVFDETIQAKLNAKSLKNFEICPPPDSSTTPAIVHAITSLRPQPSYTVGNLSPNSSFPSAKLGLSLNWLLPTACTMGFLAEKPRKMKKP
jgi:hypothetical protein